MAPRVLLLVVAALLLAPQSAPVVEAWRLPSPSRNAGTVRRRLQPLPAAVYSSPPPTLSSGRPPIEPADGSSDGSAPLSRVVTPSGYKFKPYEGEAISRLAVQQPWRVVARLSEVGLPILRWYAIVRSDEMMGQAKLEARQAVHARKLREVLVSLGPTFIKIGQALSNRPDIVGPIYVKELEKLQDTVAPFPDQIAFQLVEAELGRPATEIFEFIGGPGPVASASLGQVYKARVRETGQIVAVKVQRPNILKLAEIDLVILRAGAAWLKQARKLRSDLPKIIDEFGEALWQEIDFVHEAQNCRTFKQLYGKLEGITAPEVVDSLTTKRVLVMEWIEGTKQPQWGDDAERLISLGLECSVFQLLEEGFLHADPHPGNLLRTSDGDLCYLDMGMCRRLTETQRFGLVRAVSYLYSRDFDRLAGSLVDLGFVSRDADPAALAGLGDALRAAFSKSMAGASGGGTDGRGDSLLDLNFAKLSSNIADVAYNYPIRIPPAWSLVIRCLTILEGIALNYNPRFRIVKAVYPLVVRYLLRSSGTPVLRLALEELLLMPVQDADAFGEQYTTGRTRYRIRWTRLARFLEAASTPVNELLNPPGEGEGQAVASPSAAASSSSYSSSPSSFSALSNSETFGLLLDYILSDNGAYLREALIEDILGALEDVNIVVLRGFSLLTGGLFPAPDKYPEDQDRLALIAQLLRNLQKLATESPSALAGAGAGDRPLSASQARALAELARQVLAAMAERRVQRAVRGVFHTVERALHSRQRPARRN